MKNIKQLVMLVVSIVCINGTQAQVGKPISTSGKQPTLVNDKDAASLKAAQEHFEHKRTSATPIWKQLTPRKKQNIYRIEANRDAQLRTIDAKIDSLQQNVKSVKVAKNKTTVDATKSEIVRLTAERQQVADRATQKIKAQLTPKQKALYSRYISN